MTNYARLIKQLRVKLDLDGIRYQYIFRCTVSFACVCVSVFFFPSVIMVAATASLLSVRPVATRSAVHRPACRTRVVCAAARPEVSYRSRISSFCQRLCQDISDTLSTGQPAEEQQGCSVRSRRPGSSSFDGTVTSVCCRELHKCQAKDLRQQPIRQDLQSGLLPAQEVKVDQLAHCQLRFQRRLL